MRKGQQHTAESRAKIAAASKARVTEEMRERGRQMFRTFSEQRRIIWTPDMDKALLPYAPRAELSHRIGVCPELIARRKRELRSQGVQL